VSLDSLFKRAFGDDEPSDLGTGWVSGVVSVVCGVLALGGVLCFHFPALLTAPRLRAEYPIELLRHLLLAVIIAAFAFALASGLRRKRKVLALTGGALAALALLLGGASVPLPEQVEGTMAIGLEWFLLNLLVLALVFVPLERAFPRDPDQLVFRPGWTTDGVHFLVSHLLVQLFSFASLTPALAVREALIPQGLLSTVSALPLWVQLPAVVLLADLAQYAVHRSFHSVPALWRFHAVHHSSEQLDWIAGSRLHLFDALATRTLATLPVVALGFSPTAITAYLVFVSFHAVFIHTNVRFRLEWLEGLLVTPRIHHFHHADEKEAIDTNFAVHFPFIDRALGTQFLPRGRWPRAYGIADKSMPEGWLGQLVKPLRKR
jgi:sterol desaturase/sphingolipid hydroxylase (fatty acid hydroxylase superfamily)